MYKITVTYKNIIVTKVITSEYFHAHARTHTHARTHAHTHLISFPNCIDCSCFDTSVVVIFSIWVNMYMLNFCKIFQVFPRNCSMVRCFLTYKDLISKAVFIAIKLFLDMILNQY